MEKGEDYEFAEVNGWEDGFCRQFSFDERQQLKILRTISIVQLCMCFIILFWLAAHIHWAPHNIDFRLNSIVVAQFASLRKGRICHQDNFVRFSAFSHFWKLDQFPQKVSCKIFNIFPSNFYQKGSIDHLSVVVIESDFMSIYLGLFSEVY